MPTPAEKAKATKLRRQQERDRIERLTAAVEDLFGYGSSASLGGYAGPDAEEWVVEEPGNISFATLLDLCKIFECAPDEMFTEMDERGGGCETCGYGGTTRFRFTIRRKAKA